MFSFKIIRFPILSFILAFTIKTAYANQCLEALSGKDSSNIAQISPFGGSIASYDKLKSHPMWNHENQQLHQNAVNTFLKDTSEESAQSLYLIMQDLYQSDKLSLLKEALDFVIQKETQSPDFTSLRKKLRTKHNIVLTFESKNLGFVHHSETRVSRLSELTDLIQKFEQERLRLFDLFTLVTQHSDESLKTKTFEDLSKEDLGLHKNPQVVLLIYTLRYGYLDLFETLISSPQVQDSLHLDYGTALLDEIKGFSSPIKLALSKLIIKSFSPEALRAYNEGKRDSLGSTFWDKIPLKSY